MKLIATNFREVAKRPIDFFSIGHIIFGYVSFLIIYGVLSYLKFPLDCRTWSMFASIIGGIFWEIIENVLLIRIMSSMWGKDSVENSLSDLVFDLIGIIAGYCFSIFGWETLLSYGFIMLILLMLCMYLAIKFTQKQTENER